MKRAYGPVLFVLVSVALMYAAMSGATPEQRRAVDQAIESAGKSPQR